MDPLTEDSIHTVKGLVAARRAGLVTSPLYLDNDSTTVYQDGVRVFEMHPEDVLRQALDELGIPHEHV